MGKTEKVYKNLHFESNTIISTTLNPPDIPFQSSLTSGIIYLRSQTNILHMALNGLKQFAGLQLLLANLMAV